MPSFSTRSHAAEMMDDFAITDERLGHALANLALVNRWLGGYRAAMSVLGPYLQRQPAGRTVRVLDLGTGGADFPAYLVAWAQRRNCSVEVVGLDANPATVAWAQAALDRRLPASLRARVRVETGDALNLPYADDAFEVVVASLFVHHFSGDEVVRLVREMARVARDGILINDLHRHPVAYGAIWLLGRALPVSPMFRHDAPLSVLRGFTRDELVALMQAAGVPGCTVSWKWAFRWVATTLNRSEGSPHG